MALKHESRTRVTCHLPLGTGNEAAAVDRVITYLKEQRRKPYGVQGFTKSTPVFRGWWWSTKQRKFIADPIVLIIVDYLLDLDEVELSRQVAELRDVIKGSYAECCGRPQEEVWIVAQQVVIMVDE